MKSTAPERTILFVGKVKTIKKLERFHANNCKQYVSVIFQTYNSHRITVHINCFYTDLGSPKCIFLLPFDTPSFALGLKKRSHQNNTILWWQLAIHNRFNKQSRLGLAQNNYQMNMESATSITMIFFIADFPSTLLPLVKGIVETLYSIEFETQSFQEILSIMFS